MLLPMATWLLLKEEVVSYGSLASSERKSCWLRQTSPFWKRKLLPVATCCHLKEGVTVATWSLLKEVPVAAWSLLWGKKKRKLLPIATRSLSEREKCVP